MLLACLMPGRSQQEVQLALDAHPTREIRADAEVKLAAVAAVLRGRDSWAPEDLELLFIRRAEHPNDPWSGHMAFPGGRVDATDASALEAARREVQEEISLDLHAHGRLLGPLSHVPAISKGEVLKMVVHPFVFGVSDPELALRPDPSEVAEALWIPLSLFLDEANRGTMPYSYGGVEMRLPCYDYQGRRVWGLTLKMVDELRVVLTR